MARVRVQAEDFDVGRELESLTQGRTDVGGLASFVGLVRKNDLRDTGLGTRVGNTRVVVGAPRSGDPMQSARTPVPEGIAVMDATSIRVLDDRCPIVMR